MAYFDIGVYIFLAIALCILVVAIIVLYRNKNASSTNQKTEGKTPILVPLLAIATSGLALVLIKYIFDTI